MLLDGAQVRVGVLSLVLHVLIVVDRNHCTNKTRVRSRSSIPLLKRRSRNLLFAVEPLTFVSAGADRNVGGGDEAVGRRRQRRRGRARGARAASERTSFQPEVSNNKHFGGSRQSERCPVHFHKLISTTETPHKQIQTAGRSELTLRDLWGPTIRWFLLPGDSARWLETAKRITGVPFSLDAATHKAETQLELIDLLSQCPHLLLL